MKTQNKLCLVLIVFAAFILNGCEDGNGSTTEINASESISEKAPAPVSIEIKSFTVAPESVEKGHGVKICWEATPVDVLVEIVDSKGAKIATKTMEVQEKEEKASEASLINVKTSVVSLLSGKVIEEDNAEVKEEKKDS
ncbi:hypothetical protein KKA47_03605, partial [bacterium]|nr:hypothetical protein [bacterium]